MMKKSPILLPLLALSLASCSNEFDVAATWKEIPVAYAILSPKDSAHYIRVEKAFLSNDKSALEIARIPDSLYYPEDEIAVFLQRVKTGQMYLLRRVDGSLEGIPRAGGVFAGQPNWLYKTTPNEIDSLKKGETYQLIVKRANEEIITTARTTIPQDFEFFTPNPNDPSPSISFEPDVPTSIEWRTDSNGVYFNVTLRIRYREQATDGTLLGRDTLLWNVGKNHERGALLDNTTKNRYRGLLTVNGLSFFQFLANNIQPASDRFRYFDGIDIIYEGGGKEIRQFNLTASANAGLTGAEVFPYYTNLSEGYGIFTAKNIVRQTGIRVTPKTLNTMFDHPLTKNLNFPKN